MDNRRVVPWITKGSNVITTVTQGVTPPGPRGKKKNVAPLSFFLSTLIVTVLVTKNFLFFMDLIVIKSITIIVYLEVNKY